MWTRLHVTTILAIAAGLWFTVLLFQGTSVTLDHLKPFGTVVTLLIVIGVAFERVLWRQSWLHGWFVQRPDLRGTWNVELQSDWVDPKTGEQISPNQCFMGITQTYSKLRMHLMTVESESWLIADNIRPSPSGDGYQVVGVYINKPDLHLRRNRSEMHYGTLVVDSHGISRTRPDTLSGEYWTDRKTRGTLNSKGRIDTICTRYSDAIDSFANLPKS